MTIVMLIVAGRKRRIQRRNVREESRVQRFVGSAVG